MPVSMFHIRHHGFSVIELMVAIAILAIIVGIGIPSFQGMLERSRLDAAAGDLADALRYTRSEALQRNATVTLENAGNGFTDGWSVTASGVALRVHEGVFDGVTTSGDVADNISFDGRGVASNSVDIQFEYNSRYRCLKMTLSGSIQLLDAQCN